MSVNKIATIIQKQPLLKREDNISKTKFNNINNALPANPTRQIRIIPKLITNIVIN